MQQEISSIHVLTVAEASRMLGVGPARVRQLADGGRLPVMRTATGVRIFRVADVERLRAERSEAHA